MKRPSKIRSQRIGSEVQKVVGSFLRDEVESRVDGCMITVTEVRISDDYRHAEVFCSLHGDDEQKKQAQKLILKAAPKCKHRVANLVRMRQAPDFRFVWDDTLERADRIEQLLNKIHDSQSPPNEVEGGNS